MRCHRRSPHPLARSSAGTTTIELVEPVRALKVEAARVFDVIEDHTDFGRAILAVLADSLLAGPRTDA